jgi:hypothetical protein
MTVPVTTVYENGFLFAREDDIRAARKPLVMQAVSVAQAKKEASDLPFRPSILGANGLHDASTLFWCSSVGHRRLDSVFR